MQNASLLLRIIGCGVKLGGPVFLGIRAAAMALLLPHTALGAVEPPDHSAAMAGVVRTPGTGSGAVVYELPLAPGASSKEVADALQRMIRIAGGFSPPARAEGGAIRTGISVDSTGVTVGLVQALTRAVGPGAIVWDRNRSSLEAAGFVDARGNSLLAGARVQWLANADAYDARAAFFTSAPGRLIYGDREFASADGINEVSSRSHLSVLASSGVDRLFIAATPRAARGIGLHGAVAQGLIGNLDNWRRFYGPRGGGELLALWEESGLARKTVFAVLDARRVQIAGGPRRDALYERETGLLLGSTDPVALDARALELIDPMAVAERLPSPANDAATWLLSPDGSAPRFRLQRLR